MEGVLVSKIIPDMVAYFRDDLNTFKQYKRYWYPCESEEEFEARYSRHECSMLLGRCKNMSLNTFMGLILSNSGVPFSNGWIWCDSPDYKPFTKEVTRLFVPCNAWDKLLWHSMITPYHRGLGQRPFKMQIKNILMQSLSEREGVLRGHLNTRNNVSFRQRNDHAVEIMSLDTFEARMNSGQRLYEPREWYEVNNDFGYFEGAMDEWKEQAFEERIEQFERFCQQSTFWTILYDYNSKWYLVVKGLLGSDLDKETHVYADAYE